MVSTLLFSTYFNTWNIRTGPYNHRITMVITRSMAQWYIMILMINIHNHKRLNNYSYVNRFITWVTSAGPVFTPPSSDTYMRQWIGSVLVQIMACRSFGAKPSSEPMLGYCQFDPKEQTSVKFPSKYKTFHSRKCIWKYHFCDMAVILSTGRWVKCFIGNDSIPVHTIAYICVATHYCPS